MGFGNLEQVEKEYKIGKGGGDFMKLQTGDNRVRIVSDFEPIATHWANGKKLGVCIGKDKGCEFCAKDNKPNVKFMLWVIDRSPEAEEEAKKEGFEKKFKKLEVGYTVVKQLDDLRQDEEWSWDEETKLPGYDVNIKKSVKGTGKSPSDTSYSTIGSPKQTPLTAQEQKVFAALKPIADTVKAIKNKLMKEAVENEIQPDNPPAEEEINVDDIPFS